MIVDTEAPGTFRKWHYMRRGMSINLSSQLSNRLLARPPLRIDRTFFYYTKPSEDQGIKFSSLLLDLGMGSSEGKSLKLSKRLVKNVAEMKDDQSLIIVSH